MRSAAILMALLLAACGGPAAPVNAPEPVSHTPAEVVDAGTQLVEQWRQAWEVRSVEALAPLYAHDTDVVVVRQGSEHLGWTAVEAFLDQAVGAAVAIHLTVSDLQVAALGTGAAMVTCTLAREISDGVSAATERGTLTMALRAEGDGWVIVSEHYSYPPSAP